MNSKTKGIIDYILVGGATLITALFVSYLIYRLYTFYIDMDKLAKKCFNLVDYAQTIYGPIFLVFLVILTFLFIKALLKFKKRKSWMNLLIADSLIFILHAFLLWVFPMC